MTIDQLTSFFGWCTLLNLAMLMFAAILLTAKRDWMMDIHSTWYGVAKDDLPKTYFEYLAYYKIAIFVFNLIPYLALRIMV
jgi:hypothetical protein